MKNAIKAILIGFAYGGILAILTMLFPSCQSETLYPDLTEGNYVQLEFINEDNTIETSQIVYQK